MSTSIILTLSLSFSFSLYILGFALSLTLSFALLLVFVFVFFSSFFLQGSKDYINIFIFLQLLNRKDNADKKLKQTEHKGVDPKEVEHKKTEHKELPKKKIISEKIEQIQHKADELREAANEAHQDITKDEEVKEPSRVWTYVLVSVGLP